jgi:hypothetical protein
MKNGILLGLSVIFLFNLMACNNQLPNPEETTNNMDKAVYRFRDSSTPPKYHRSYTVTVTEENVHTTVDVYGTILADTTHATPPGKFEELQKAASSLESPKEKDTPGATGTKGYSISLYKGNERYYYLYWDSLQEVKPASEKYANLIKSASPDLGELLFSPYPDRGE